MTEISYKVLIPGARDHTITHSERDRVNIWSQPVPDAPDRKSLSIIHYLYKLSYYSGTIFPIFYFY